MCACVHISVCAGERAEADSGLAGLIFLIKQHTGHELSKEDAGLRALQARLAAEFDAGRQTAVEWEEIADEAATVVANGGGVAAQR